MLPASRLPHASRLTPLAHASRHRRARSTLLACGFFVYHYIQILLAACCGIVAEDKRAVDQVPTFYI